jgi:hypothetical protein
VRMELSKVEQRYDAVLAVIRDVLTISEAAIAYGVSRQSSIGGCSAMKRAGCSRSPSPVLLEQEPPMGRMWKLKKHVVAPADHDRPSIPPCWTRCCSSVLSSRCNCRKF